MDYNKIFSVGDVDGGVVNVVVEVPLGTNEKYEWNSQNFKMEIDRLEPVDLLEPVNYGFIPRTIGADGDALDAFIISENSIQTGMVIQAKIIGVMKFIDEGVIDDKIVAVLLNDSINGLADVPKDIIYNITNFFTHYKDMYGKDQTKVGDWLGVDDAKKIIIESNERWQKIL